jgi:cytochrome c oxidase cbb3-type subunit 3
MSDKIIHEYDDIKEADNDLPRWWLWILFGSIVFAACYWIWFEVLKVSPSPLGAMREEKRRAAEAEAERIKASGPLTDDKLVEMSHSGPIVSAGKATFAATCATCHGPAGGGNVGPNLTDKYWLHGGKPQQILATIRQGVLDKGMPAWGPQLGEEKVRELAAYVLTLKGTNVAGGKAPQGEPEVE